MKINRINTMKNFGIFNDYSSKVSSIKNFDTHNIIFGWNYSGKTTLSKLFSTLQNKSFTIQYSHAVFEVDSDHGIIDQNNFSHNTLDIRVFNSDYIRDNLKWYQADKRIQPILILGEKKGNLFNIINDLNKCLAQIDLCINKYESELKTLNKNLDDILTEKARQFTDELNLGRAFDRRKLRAMLDDQNVESWKLEEEDYKKCEEVVRSPKFDNIDGIMLSLDKSKFDHVFSTLSKVVKPSISIERLKNDKSLESWVYEGKKYHIAQEICKFCGNPLPPSLIKDLDDYFSQDYENLVNSTKLGIKNIDNLFLATYTYHKSQFSKVYHVRFDNLYKKYINTIETYNNTVKVLKSLLISKLSNLSQPIHNNLDLTIIDSIHDIINELNTLISDQNKYNNNFEDEQKAAKNNLLKHKVCLIYRFIDYKKNIENIERLKDLILEYNSEKAFISNENNNFKKDISEAEKGANLLNNYIKRYFGDNTPINIRVVNSFFGLYHNEQPAYNLSDGEKTAISFAYFLASLKDKNNISNIANMIIYIDDPISSLDSNHLYSTYALITSEFKNKCGQLFISTHNYEFFNLLKDEFKPWKGSKCKFNDSKERIKNNEDCKTYMFEIKRAKNNVSYIENIDCLHCTFKSEYQYLFFLLNDYINSPEKQSDEFLSFYMPNILRRFLEVFLGFMYPNGKPLRQLSNIISEPHLEKYILKIANDISHNENVERSLKLFNPNEIIDAINKCFNGINEKYPNYIKSLKDSILIS